MNEELKILGEERVVEKILELYVDGPGPGERLPKGDDARDLLLYGLRVVTALDGYNIDAVRLPWRDLSDIGWCAVTSVVSDIVAKGASPSAILIGLGVPGDWKLEDLTSLFKGIKDASQHYGLRILGGDLNSSNDPWISVAGIGFSSGYTLPSRKGAKPGDIVVITGSSYGAMGIVALDGIDKAGQIDWVRKHTKRPFTHTELAYIIQNYSKAIHSTMDVSDGLAYTLHTIAKESNISIKIKDKPRYIKELDKYCNYDEKCIWNRILYGGEEYGVVMTIDRNIVDKVLEELDRLEIPYAVVGEVVEGEPQIFIEGYGTLRPVRWDQFKRSWI